MKYHAPHWHVKWTQRCDRPRLGIESIATATLCQGALLRAIRSGMPVYDTLFIELAARAVCPW
jgi:hypothetical protein